MELYVLGKQLRPVVIKYMTDNNKRKDKHWKKLKNYLKILLDNLISAQKAKTIQQKQLIYTDAQFSNAFQISYYALFQLDLPTMW